jgi:hypothetical protein
MKTNNIPSMGISVGHRAQVHVQMYQHYYDHKIRKGEETEHLTYREK